MPWLVSMRMIGHGIGARPTAATRRSVIFRSDGFELVLTFWGSVSSVSFVHALSGVPAQAAPAPAAAAARFRKVRRVFVIAVLLPAAGAPGLQAAFSMLLRDGRLGTGVLLDWRSVLDSIGIELDGVNSGLAARKDAASQSLPHATLNITGFGPEHSLAICCR